MSETTSLTEWRRAREADAPPEHVGKPLITFGWDDDSPVTFRDQGVLDEYVADAITEARLSGWVPFGTYVGVTLPDDRAFECSPEEEGGIPTWERIVTRTSEPTS